MWRVGRALDDLKNAVIVLIHTKGSRMESANYKGVSLMSIVVKGLQEFK